jgi:hypothetical protein
VRRSPPRITSPPGPSPSRPGVPALPKRNYQFEKRQKELDKQRKKEEKLQRRQERTQQRTEEGAETDADQPPVEPGL